MLKYRLYRVTPGVDNGPNEVELIADAPRRGHLIKMTEVMGDGMPVILTRTDVGNDGVLTYRWRSGPSRLEHSIATGRRWEDILRNLQSHEVE